MDTLAMILCIGTIFAVIKLYNSVK
jgi:hypothetical protein